MMFIGSAIVLVDYYPTAQSRVQITHKRVKILCKIVQLFGQLVILYYLSALLFNLEISIVDPILNSLN